jgi:hypothetical protein
MTQICGDTSHLIDGQPGVVVDDARNVAAAVTSGKMMRGVGWVKA